MTIPLAWVDAFSDAPFGGNPAGVCLLDQPLDEARMQSIAFELGIAETAFLVPDETAGPTTFGLRWFSPATEIDLCGHATLASAHALRQWGTVDGTSPLTFHTKSGPLHAAFDGDRVVLDFPADPVTAAPHPASLASQWPGGVLFSGHTEFFCFVVLASAEAVRAYEPDLEAIAATGAKALLLTAAAAPASGADYVLRVFGPNVGIPEDPGTGSAQCSAGPSGPPSWDAKTWWRGSSPTRRHPLRAPRGGAGADRRPRNHRAGGSPVLVISPAMNATAADLRALVEGHQPQTPREAAAQARSSKSWPASRLPATSTRTSRTSPRRASWSDGAARCCTSTSASASGCSPAGTSTPGETPDVAARREAIEELGLTVEHLASGPRLINIDVHAAALGHTHLDLRYLLVAGDDDPHPPPGESPEARWYSWDEALALADPALADALPVARVAYETEGSQ